MPAVAEKPAKKDKDEAFKNPFALKGKPKEEVLDVKDLVRMKELQARGDTDRSDEDKGTDGTFILERAEKFAEAMKAGEADNFPPIKVVRIVKAGPDEKNPHEGKLLIFDGMNQHRARELAKVKTAKCLVWEGTREQALNAAATVANREHERGGKVLTNKDKERSLKMLAEQFKRSDIPKKEWPSNRQAALLVGCSHNFVNSIDPFERARGDIRDELNAKKRAGSGAASDATPTPPPPPEPAKRDPVNGLPVNFQVVDEAGKVLAEYYDKSPGGALDRYCLETAKADRSKLRVNPVKAPELPKNGAPAANGTPAASPNGSGFDWKGFEERLSWLSRAIPAWGEMCGINKDPDFAKFAANFEAVCKFFQDKQAKLGKKK